MRWIADDRLRRLAELADMKAEKSLAELSRAQSAVGRLKGEIQALDDEASAYLNESDNPASSRLAHEFAKMRRTQRADLMSELARLERERQASLRMAQKEEGRRIALTRLRDQAS